MICKFTQILKELRVERNLQQKELAEILKVSKSTISGWEIGRNQPAYEMLLSIAQFFNVSVDYLIGNSDEWGNVATSGTISSMQKPSQTLTQDEQQLIEAYRNFSEGKKKALCDMLDIEPNYKKPTKIN